MKPRRRIADDLEPGPLRAEMGGAPIAPPPPPLPDGAIVERMTFTGRGGEYFRIWIVNLFLSVVTLGIYSAWAKVRKTKYFCQNTRLDGHVFDFHGNPMAILRGRIVALVLLLAYSWAFEFSTTAGLVTVAILLAIGPLLFVKAQQFKFGNTSHRGLRFGFAASYADGYRVVLPILAIWFSTTVAAAVVVDRARGPGWVFGVVFLVSLLAFPGMHHRLKAFQHGYATFGERRFHFVPVAVEFYWIYTKGLALMVAGVIFGSVVVGVAVVPMIRNGADANPPDWLWLVSGAAFSACLYLCAWPFLAARLQQLVWANSRLADIRFRTEIAAWPLFKLVARNIGLTLVTAGIYWPYASIALARYRVDCMRIDADMPFAMIVAGTRAPAARAIGDAAADTFGFDFGL